MPPSSIKSGTGAEFEAEVASRIADAEKAHAMAIQLAEAKIIEQKDSEFANKDKQIERLKGDLQKKDMEIKIAVSDATNPLQNQLLELQNRVNNADTEKSLMEKTLTEKHQIELKAKDQIIQMKDDEIELRKDMKMKLSTKMLGETLEQHCELQFEQTPFNGVPSSLFREGQRCFKGNQRRLHLQRSRRQ